MGRSYHPPIATHHYLTDHNAEWVRTGTSPEDLVYVVETSERHTTAKCKL